MKYSPSIREEELKNKVAKDFFNNFDATEIIKNIDFAIRLKRCGDTLEFNDEYLLWAEAKRNKTISAMFAQLVLTIGKARTFDKILPPPFLGCFDCEKIAFVPYADIQNIFYQNDFNWNVAPSDHETREFRQVMEQIERILDGNETYIFDFEKDEKELIRFIRDNFIIGKRETTKIRIDKNNFIIIYNKWLEAVQPTIAVKWEKAKARGIIDGDFYLADLLSVENKTLKEKLFVLLRGDYYEFDRVVDEADIYNSKRAEFSDRQKAHTQFWAKYERPPLEEYWDYIIERRDLLVPQDVRERKGSFFTPKIWVELSQKYLADVLGEDWQDDYYVWDCAAGTGNLLAGLINKYNIWASTLDKADVDVMKDRIRNGANLLEDHVFQFDFLNDEFTKLPQGLQNIINDPEKRKKLVIYINPPYAEAPKRVFYETGKKAVEQSKMNEKYAEILGQGNREVFVQFFTRIYSEIPGIVLAEFSKLKILQGQHFVDFRKFFLAELKKIFICPANSFDNVKGSFPIGFMIWDTSIKEKFENKIADIYNNNGIFIGEKGIYSCDNSQYINDWIKPFRAKKEDKFIIGKFPFMGNDFQQQNIIQINTPEMLYNKAAGQFLINANNLIQTSIYFAVRKVIPADWLNDRDQFLYPNDNWKTDEEFQNDCLAYTLFSNNIQSQFGTNHWIPFTENEVDSRDKFDSNFMTDFMTGKIKQEQTADLFSCVQQESRKTALAFSAEAQAVLDAGRKLWKYYQAHSENETYNELIGNLRTALKTLAKKIEPKVYEYGFLKE